MTNPADRIEMTGTRFAFESDQVHRHIIEPVQPEPGYLFYPVHAWLHRSGLYPLLPPGARSLLDVLLWQEWEQRQRGDCPAGLVTATIEQFAAWCGCSSRTTYRDIGFLLEPSPAVLIITGTPARLLAQHGPTIWEPLPGRVIARRKPTSDPPPTDGRLTRVSKLCHENSALNRDSARPSHTKDIQTKTEERGNTGERARPETTPIVARGFGMGWPEWSLFGQRAIASGDVRGVLADMKLGGPLLDATAALPHLTVHEIRDVAAAVAIDPEIRNPLRRPVAVAWRLHRARGMAMPQSHKGGKSRGLGMVMGTPQSGGAATVQAAVAALSAAAGLEEIRRRRGTGS